MELKDLMNYIEENKEEHFHDLIAKNEREIAKKEEEEK
ncbi:hypothetical protein ICM_06464 [Bacillus cereus BAG1X2-3]|nr:hypothetical protein bcere0025_54940 [Bacillus cereus F65185]EJR29656.1 hypothetical protein IIE_04896 [Bacillus cereus VD045]EJR73720.1 hypothetical protein IK9_05255 [Bacillus cereus VD166]EOO05829.1 hypothetical protein IAW_04912 [Bacillus cereus str. Schrouff]EOO24752.1 hypothetical protein ICC_05139 [Bacillus cereus BAG1X1-1]EOO42741.1 hypothetical protein ICI_06368 [Bacillus cereus BAG1X2-1]EOO46349.1 hypothetical protein ICK_05381 [Bacillus cereus BAG1X2-2]EOO62042.1 hypothetical p